MVRTRFAPSPSGRIHLGNARTALFNAWFAAHAGGEFLLRIEDTDAERSHEDHVDAILRDLRWLGLAWSEGPDVGGPHGPYQQSRRGSIYAEYLAALEAGGHAYPCFCTPHELAAARAAAVAAGRTPRYPGTCANLDPASARRRLAAGEPAALRFRVPGSGSVEFDDLVRGAQRVSTDTIGDFVIRRADGSPPFFFANALDDALMQVSHVMRGEDHLANTPRQLLVLAALDLAAPRYGHLPLVNDAAGHPLSKRECSTGIETLRDQGVLPAAVANYLHRLGHATPSGELLDAAGLVREFDPARLGRAGARFDAVQLEHWQRLAIQALSAEEAADWAGYAGIGAPRWPQFWALVRGNVGSRLETAAWAQALAGPPVPDAQARGSLAAAPGSLFAHAAALADEDSFERASAHLREHTGLRGARLFKPLRAALTGRTEGPELAALWEFLPAAERRARLESARACSEGARNADA